MNRLHWYSKNLCPFSNAAMFTAKPYDAVVAFVSRLLASCSPTAIAWFIVAVVVDPVNFVLIGWSRTHIRQEVGEVVPSFTNSNAATAVILESGLVAVAASTAHGHPYRKRALGFWIAGVPVRPASDFGAFACELPAKASATLGVSILERSTPDRYRRAATRALARPMRTASPDVRHRNNRQSPEGLSVQVLDPRSSDVSFQASARSGVTGCKVRAAKHDGLSALAFAVPQMNGSGMPSDYVGMADHRKASENKPSQVFEDTGNAVTIAGSHDVNLHEGLRVVRAGQCFSTASGSFSLSQSGYIQNA